jgi:hypothetical protein
MEYLIKQGHRRIGYIHGIENMDDAERFRAYRNVLKKHNLLLEEEIILNGCFEEIIAFNEICQMVLRGVELPDAFFCANDEMAWGCIKALATVGVSVPGQVSVLGFDNIMLAAYYQPALTTVGNPVIELGEKSAMELLRMIRAVWIDLGPKTMEEYDGRPVYKMVFVSPGEDRIAAAMAELGEELEFIIHDFSEPDCIFGEIINRKFDKGSSALLVAKSFGCDAKDTIGFGDSMLDIGLIRAVGTSVCMDSGSPKLKEISDMVCPSVNEDGIEWAFRKLGLI